MPKPILIIQTGNVPQIISGIDTFDAIFLNMANYHNIETVVRHVMFESMPRSASTFSGVIVTGSTAMVTDRKPWSENCAAWLRTAIETETSVLGICFGHQLIAQAFGGQVIYHPQGLELGTHEVNLNPKTNCYDLFTNLPAAFKANMAHSQTVLVPPIQAVTVAASDHDPHQILMYGSKTATFQFHPEFNGAIMKTYIHSTTSELKTVSDQAIKWGLPIEDTPVAASLLQRFINNLNY
ncbi:MAG: glutamine amidotransferase [Candidatus Adiutrix intracellularis]|jgi:GMP synthase (glutamine-hydrolysing)|nr:glutamine amidotransferase [Candidatus Adiutrix intracellularis]